MSQIISGLNELGLKDWIDTILVLASLLLSVVAIGISIATAKKQNKIALFNMRYEALHSLTLVLSYAKMIVGIEKEHMAKYLFNANFSCEIKYDNKDEALYQTYVELRKIEKSVLVVGYLFSKNAAKEIQNIFVLLRNFMERLVEDEVNLEWRDKLCAACEAFEKRTYKKIDAKTKL